MFRENEDFIHNCITTAKLDRVAEADRDVADGLRTVTNEPYAAHLYKAPWHPLGLVRPRIDRRYARSILIRWADIVAMKTGLLLYAKPTSNCYYRRQYHPKRELQRRWLGCLETFHCPEFQSLPQFQ